MHDLIFPVGKARVVLNFLANHVRGVTGRSVRRFADECPLGLKVKLEAVQEKHTESQSGYYWPMLRQFGNELGYTARESETVIHNEILAMTFGRESREIRVPTHGNTDWDHVYIYVPNQRSAGASKTDYSTLIDHLLVFAGENGVNLPDPRPPEER